LEYSDGGKDGARMIPEFMLKVSTGHDLCQCGSLIIEFTEPLPNAERNALMAKIIEAIHTFYEP